jgi:hypothetical protein
VRASDAEREATVVRLRDAAGEGRLTFEELAERIEVTGRAVTRAELDRLTADLPAGVAPVAPAAGPPAPPVRASTVFGDVRRSGRWALPTAGRWQSLFGDVVLDVREARVPAGEIHVDAGTVFGDVQLLVPDGVEIEVRSRTLFGDVRQEAGEVAPPGAPRIVLTGGTVFGDVRVRAHRRRERLAARLRGDAGR